MTLVYYYIPEDGDELTMPNAYAINKETPKITLADIEAMFPLKSQANGCENFIFRFKYKLNGQSVWMDLANKKIPVPKCDGKIIMKVNRKVPKFQDTQ